MYSNQDLSTIGHFNITRLYWITTFNPTKGPQNRTIEDLETLASRNDIALRIYTTRSTYRFERRLKNILSASQQHDGVLIIFDMHGDSEKGLKLNGQEYASWTYVCRKLRPINQKTQHKLVVFSSVCFGKYLLTGIESLKNFAPFFCQIGAEHPISAGSVHDSLLKILPKLLLPDNKQKTTHISDTTINKALEEIKPPELTTTFSYRFFIATFEKYIIDHCTGPAKAKRVTNLVSEVKKLNASIRPRNARRIADKIIKKHRSAFESYWRTFIGSPVNNSSYEQVKRSVKDQDRK